MPNTKKPHILIVDDDAFATDALTHILEKRDMKVTIVQEGEEAIGLLKKKKFDLVLLDIRLPLSEINGWQVLQEMKSNKKTSAYPVYVLSNAGLQHEIQRGLDLGADKYWLKAHTSIHDVADAIEHYFKKK